MEEINFYTATTASTTLGISRMTMNNWIHSGKIGYIVIKGDGNYVTYAIPVKEVEKKLKEEKNIVKVAIMGTYKQYGDVLEKLADE